MHPPSFGRNPALGGLGPFGPPVFPGGGQTKSAGGGKKKATKGGRSSQQKRTQPGGGADEDELSDESPEKTPEERKAEERERKIDVINMQLMAEMKPTEQQQIMLQGQLAMIMLEQDAEEKKKRQAAELPWRQGGKIYKFGGTGKRG